MTCDFAYESGRRPWARHEVSLSQDLSFGLGGYLVFLLATDSEVESARLVIRQYSGTHAVSQSANWTGLPSSLISAT